MKQILDSKITLYILLGVFAFFLLSQYKNNQDLKQENKALEAANKVQDAQFEELKKSNQLEIDSLKTAVKFHNQFLADLTGSYSDLEEKYHDILNSLPNEEDHIRGIIDADSLYNEIARHYRR